MSSCFFPRDLFDNDDQLKTIFPAESSQFVVCLTSHREWKYFSTFWNYHSWARILRCIFPISLCSAHALTRSQAQYLTILHYHIGGQSPAITAVRLERGRVESLLPTDCKKQNLWSLTGPEDHSQVIILAFTFLIEFLFSLLRPTLYCHC